ncbi:MAG TPA: hypothetical protein VGC86_17390, partial [Afipia sp.]
GITYFSILDALCPDRHCPVRLAGGALMSWDTFNMTAEGSLLAAPYLTAAIKSVLQRRPE